MPVLVATVTSVTVNTDRDTLKVTAQLTTQAQPNKILRTNTFTFQNPAVAADIQAAIQAWMQSEWTAFQWTQQAKTVVPVGTTYQVTV